MAENETPATGNVNESELQTNINAAAAGEGFELPKGNKAEQEAEKIAASQQPKKRGPKPGKKAAAKEAATSSQQQQQAPAVKEPEPDFLTPIINDSLIPIVEKRTGRKPGALKYSEAELKMLAALKPPVQFDEPSWPAYIITAVSMVVIHYFGTSKEAAPAEEKKEVIIQSRQNEPAENKPAE